jgi:hypothetical protein
VKLCHAKHMLLPAFASLPLCGRDYRGEQAAKDFFSCRLRRSERN